LVGDVGTFEMGSADFGPLPALSLRDLPPNPTRMASQVEHGHYSGLVLRFQVVDAKREPVGQHPETAILLPMNSMTECQAFDVRQ
jgi:hypothetical protein